MPGINYYFMQHPEALQREWTMADVIIMTATIVVLGVVVYVATRF